jgi:Tfp pilus assembly protein PilO
MMKAASSNRLIIAILVVVAIGAAFWMFALSPKRERASQLSEKVEREEVALAENRQLLATAEAARREFPADYEKLVALGKAVPADDEAASLIVDLHAIAERSGIRFQEISLESDGEAEATAASSAESEPAPPTEVGASLLPLGATIGGGGLATMPYKLVFTGRYHEIEEFISGIDSLVDSTSRGVAVNGRLITINGFALETAPNELLPRLKASFSVTTFVTPPGEGGTAGATPLGPATETETETASPASATTEVTP